MGGEGGNCKGIGEREAGMQSVGERGESVVF